MIIVMTRTKVSKTSVYKKKKNKEQKLDMAIYYM